MYSGKFVRISKAAQITSMPKSELIGMGVDGNLSIFAWNQSWVRESLPRPLGDGTMAELPRGRYNLTSPILIDDEAHLESLVNGESIIFGGNADVPIVCYKDSTDDNYLDGVVVTQANLYCLKSEIEELKNKALLVNLASESVTEADDQTAQKEWQILESDAEGEKILQAELEAERQLRNAELEKGIDFEWKTETNLEQAEKNAKSETDKTKEWKAKAREIGKDWMDTERKEGRNPGVDAIAKHVEGEFKRLDIRGKRDDYLNWQTIKKEALTGITGKPPNGKTPKS